MLPRGIKAVFRSIIRRPWSIRVEVEDEIDFHLQERIDALVARGWSVSEATDEAHRRFGDSPAAREALMQSATRRERRLDVLEWLESARHDFAIAARQLRRSPSFAAGTIGAIALGIGANATMFNVLDRLLLRPPAQVRAPGEIYTLGIPTRAHVPAGFTSFPIFESLRDNLHPIAPVSMQTLASPLPIERSADGALAQSVFVDGGYFRTLGAHAALGRTLGDEDARAPDGQRVAVIGYGFWKRQFGGDPNVVGREIDVSSQRVRIVGVAAEGFSGIGLTPIDLWLPVPLAGAMMFMGPEWATSSMSSWLFTFARVPPSVSVAQIEARATAAFLAVPRRRASAGMAGSVKLHSIFPSRAESLSPEAKVASMLGAVALLVLLIACSNAGTLMLARFVRQRREIGVRMALGGSRRRIARQLVTDAMLLAALGGIAAVIVAACGSAFMRSVLLEGFVWDGSMVDARSVAVIGILVITAGVITGMIPALFLRTFDISHAIGDAGPSSGKRGRRTISALVVIQTTLSVALLIGAVLFVRSLRAVHGIPLGIDAEHTVVVSLDTRTLRDLSTLSPAAGQARFDELASRIGRVPGVASTAIAEGIPFGSFTCASLRVPGSSPEDPVAAQCTSLSAVTSGYFSTIGTHIVEGRAFSSNDDRADAAPVTILSARLAKMLWPSERAIGHCVRFGRRDSLPCRRVIGIAEDAHTASIVERDSPSLRAYLPLSQGKHDILSRVILARTSSPAGATPMLRGAIQAYDPRLPFPDIWPIASHLESELRPWRLGATMFGAFGALSLVLATLGLYSVMAYGVAQRKQEMAIRVALGARRIQILALVSREGSRLAVFGATIGIVVAAVSAPLVQPLLFETSARSIVAYLGVATGMILVAIIACLIPASTAAKSDPMIAIRSD